MQFKLRENNKMQELIPFLIIKELQVVKSVVLNQERNLRNKLFKY